MSDKVYLGRNVASYESAPDFTPYTKVILRYDEDDNAFEAGDETGRVLESFCPWATQAMADAMLARLQGAVYRPFSATSAQLDPAAELGDGVTVNGTYTLLAKIDTDFDAAMVADVEAPADEEVDHEYPYLAPTNRELNRRVRLGANYYGTRITRKSGLEIVKTEADGTEKSRVVLNSDLLAFYNDDGNEALYFDAAAGKFRFRGDVVVTGGSMNINDNFIVDEEGNLSINGNINLSGGTITWGGNLPPSGISSSTCRTIINNQLVSSPNIAGAKFWDLDQTTWIEIAADASTGKDAWGLILRNSTYRSPGIFGIYNADFGGVALYAKGYHFMVTDAETDTTSLYGTWDFSDADIAGNSLNLTASSGDILLQSSGGDIRLSAGSGEVRIYAGGVTWHLDDTGWHK